MINQSNLYNGGFQDKTPWKSASKNFSKNAKPASNTSFSGGFHLSESTKKTIYTSRAFKKFAKMASNPVLLEATTVLGLSCLLRPITIMAIPGAEKRDKQYASAHSIVTGIWTYATTLAIYNPINKAVRNVSKRLKEDPTYLKNSFIRKNEKLHSAFEFIASTAPRTLIHPFLGSGIILLLPVAMKLFFPKPPHEEAKHSQNIKSPSSLQFKGKAPEKPLNFFQRISQKIESKIEKHIVEPLAHSKKIEKYAQKMSESSKSKSDLLKQIINTTTGFLGTLVYIGATIMNPKIEEDRKKTLTTNYFITWGLSAIGAVYLNKGVMKSFEKMSENFKKYNIREIEENFAKKLAQPSHDKTKLLEEKAKELEKITFSSSKLRENAATMICYAVMYRYITPVIATPLAELSKKVFPPKKQDLAKS